MSSVKNDLLTTAQAADRLHMAQKTLEVYRSTGRGPEFLKLPDGSVRYHRRALAKWILGAKHTPGPDPGPAAEEQRKRDAEAFRREVQKYNLEKRRKSSAQWAKEQRDSERRVDQRLAEARERRRKERERKAGGGP